MNDDLEKIFKILDNLINTIINNNNVIDEKILMQNPDILFTLLHSISIKTNEAIYTNYFYNELSNSCDVIEYLKVKGIKLDEFYKEYDEKMTKLEEKLDNFSVNIDSVINYLSKLFNDVDKFKKFINDINYDNALKFLFVQYLKVKELNNLSDEIIKLFISKIGKMELLSLLKKNLSISENNLLKEIYDNLEFSNEEIQEIIDKDLLIGVEHFKNIDQIIENEYLVKQLLIKKYYNIVQLLTEEQFIRNYNLIEPLLSNNMYEILNSCKCLTILNNGDVFDKIYNHIDSTYYIEMFLKIMPNDYSDKMRITKCLLQSEEYDDFNGVVRYSDDWLDNIELAIKNGYKCNNLTKISTTEELRIFIKYGQTQAINNVDKKMLNYEIVNECMQNGLNIKLDNHYSKYLIERYINEHENTNAVLALKTWLYFCPSLQYEFMSENEINKSFTEEGPTTYFLEKTLFTRKLFFSLYKEKSILKKNSYLSDEIIQYIDFVLNNFNLVSFIKKIDDIDIYFDEFGPTEKLYEKAFTSEEIFYSLFKNNNKYLNNFKDRYNCFDYVIKYLEFVKNHSLFNTLSQYVNNINDVISYYNAFGPTEKLYSLALVDPTLFNALLKNNNYFSVCNFPKNIENYIKFARTNNFIITYIKNIDDINKYFDEDGITKELYLIGLFDMNYFNNMYNDYKYISVCNYSKEVESYIQFVKKNKIMFDFIKTIPDIEKYFNKTGPKQLLFEKGLVNISLFRELYRKDIYKYYCNYAKSIEYYISFIKKYGIMFSFINDVSDIEKYFDSDGPNDTLKNYFKQNKEIAASILNSAAHNNQILKNLGTDFVNIFEYYIKDNYFTNIEENKREEKYNYLLKNIGPHIIFNLDSAKIQRFIELDINELDKFFKVIYCSNVKVLTPEMSFNNLVQSVLRFKFEKENSELINIFTNIKSLLEHMNNDEFDKYIEGKVIGELSIKLNYYINQIIDKLNINKEEDKEKLKNSIIKYKMELKGDDLYKFCRAYVKKCRTSYTEQHKGTILSELGVPLSYNREDAVKKMNVYFMREMTYRDYWINLDRLKDRIPINEYNVLKTITLEEFDLIINRGKKPDPSIVKKIKPFNIFLSEYSKDEFDNRKSDSLLEFLQVKKENYILLKDIDVIEIIKEFDIDIFLNTVGQNKKVLNSLSKIFQSFYLGKLPECMSNFFCDSNELGKKLPGGINNIGAFITRYYQILVDKKRRLEMQKSKEYNFDEISFTFSEVVKAISNVNTETREIRRLIGSEEYGDFISNESPNTNSYDRISREDKLVQLLDYLYTLDKITIPAKDVIISNGDNSKQINFVVGNRTNPSNICHGERTGACMRIGGAGEGLFLKCLTDKNWFHIRIEDPITHKYISRVSGFRNGNTVYLNQLRETSDSSKYTNEDLQEFIRIYAESLIEDTKDSEYPIENVFINDKYAMESNMSKKHTLGSGIQSEYNLDGIREYKLNNSNDIWTDVRNSAILLATTEEGKKTLEGYAHLKNGPDNALEYNVARDKIYGMYYDEKIVLHQFIQIDESDIYEKINRVYCMKQKLLGEDFKHISDISLEGIVDAYVSSDWYVYIDSNYEIHSDYISEIKRNDQIVPYGSAIVAQQEMEKVIQILISKYNINYEKEVRHAI